MAWRFDAIKIDIVWVNTTDELISDSSIDLGSIDSDLSVDTGNRTNDSGVIDQGERII